MFLMARVGGYPPPTLKAEGTEPNKMSDHGVKSRCQFRCQVPKSDSDVANVLPVRCRAIAPCPYVERGMAWYPGPYRSLMLSVCHRLPAR